MTANDLPNESLVKAWMNPPDFTIKPNASVDEAFGILKREHIRHLLVVDDGGDLVGVVTDRDLRRPDWDGGEIMSVKELYKLGDELRVQDVMTDEVQTVKPNTSTAEAARMMAEEKIDCLPVVREGEVVGILTSTDLLAALVYEKDPVAMEARASEG